MRFLRFCLYRLHRLHQKFSDLYSTSGSFWRASFYIVKFVIAKLPYLLAHVMELRHARHFEAELRRRRQASPGHRNLAIKMSGGIGDYLVAARFIRDLQAQSEPFLFDVYCNNADIATWIFRDFPGFCGVGSEFNFERAVEFYDCGLWTSQFVITYRGGTSSLLPPNARLDAALRRIDAFRPSISTFVARHPFLDNELARYAGSLSCTRADFMHHMAGLPYGGDRLAIASDDAPLAQHGLTRRRYITIHNGFDPAFVITGAVATKCYPHFSRVVRLLKAALPDIIFVQIGTSTSTPIDGVDIDLINRTSIAQAAGLVEHALLHIDNESGLVHLARCYGVRSCVVFGPTLIDYFAYPDNINLPPPVCGGCWWMNETWMDQCPRGHREPICMTQQDPERIAAAVLDALRGGDRGGISVAASPDATGPKRNAPLARGVAASM